MYITDEARIYSGIRSGKFRYLGRGAGRHVFDMGDGRVVKVARNDFGYTQNKTEYELSLAYKGDLFAKVISASEDYRLLIMQAAKWITSLTPVLNYYGVRSTNELFNVPEIFALIRNHKLVAREFLRPRNWGVIGGRPVIIDYGIIWASPLPKSAVSPSSKSGGGPAAKAVTIPSTPDKGEPAAKAAISPSLKNSGESAVKNNDQPNPQKSSRYPSRTKHKR